jgi:eukaryotic-like serine/threonine-protein kinase
MQRKSGDKSAQTAFGETVVDPELSQISPAALSPTGPAPDRLGSRYRPVAEVGRGGMGVVYEVDDADLHRRLAMKVLTADPVDRPALAARFIAEAQVTSQLQHPGIVPVYEIGTLDDGRLYFTMQLVLGRTLAAILGELHEASGPEGWGVGAGGWTFRRTIDALHQATQAVAYAHSQHVVHRDLKPANVMVGAFGDVKVMDWGLAKVRGVSEPVHITTDRAADDAHATRVGAIAGTPAYMAPEQAAGRFAELTPAGDVWALGAMLYGALCGRRPYEGSSADVLAGLLEGPPCPLRELAAAAPPMPEELVEVCERAMAYAPEDRYPSAAEMAEAIGAWLAGARRRERALRLVAKATALFPEVAAMRARADQLAAEGAAELAAIPRSAEVADKIEAWDKQDRGAALAEQADRRQHEAVATLGAALTHEPALAEAHEALAAHHHREHLAAETSGLDASRAEVRLRAHVGALAPGTASARRYRAYLKGDGALTLRTDPPGATVMLERYELRQRRLVATAVCRLGSTPLNEVSLPMGSYRLQICSQDRAVVRYPVHIRRQQHWHGVAPGETGSRPIPLPTALDVDDVYVPAGWFSCGGDPAVHFAHPPTPVWVEGFIVKRTAVSNAHYLTFLDSLVAAGREEEALRHAPRERGGAEGGVGALLVGRRRDGTFVLQPDAEGDMWDLAWPAVMIDHRGALAYAAWLAARTGQPWRLLRELEWEKAARGVDGRHYPWGDAHDPSWAKMVDTDAGRKLPGPVGVRPVDCSPYGACDMAGNARTFCQDPYAGRLPALPKQGVRGSLPEHGLTDRKSRVERGGDWSAHEGTCRSAYRAGHMPGFRYTTVGVRVARTWPVGVK